MSERPKPLHPLLQSGLTIFLLLLPFMVIYYFSITDIARDPIEIKEETFDFPNSSKDFDTISLGKLFLNTELFLRAEKNQTNGTPIQILLLDKSSYDDFQDGEFTFFFDPVAEITLEGDTVSVWINESMSTETSFYVILQETSPGDAVTITISYWLEYPTLLERDLLGIITVVGGAYLLLFFGKRFVVKYRLKRYRKARAKQRKKEEDEYYQKMSKE